MCRKSLRVLKNALSATALSQLVMASYQECTARLAARGSMEHAFTSGSSLVANPTARTVSHHGEAVKADQGNACSIDMT